MCRRRNWKNEVHFFMTNLAQAQTSFVGLVEFKAEAAKTGNIQKAVAFFTAQGRKLSPVVQQALSTKTLIRSVKDAFKAAKKHPNMGCTVVS